MNRNKHFTHENTSIFNPWTKTSALNMNIPRSLIHEPKQARCGNPTVLNLINKENSISLLKEMHFTNGVPVEC